jgi:ribonuclease PH
VIHGITLDTGALIALMAAGVALGLVSNATPIDALVMASAALRGGTVYTSDLDDLERLRAGVPGFADVQVVRV